MRNTYKYTIDITITDYTAKVVRKAHRYGIIVAKEDVKNLEEPDLVHAILKHAALPKEETNIKGKGKK